MQIKTGVSIALGIAIGYILFRDIDDKEKLIRHVKRLLYRLQTGESLPEKKKAKPTPANHYKDNIHYKPLTYKDYFQKQENDEFIYELSKFEDEDMAKKAYEELVKIANTYGNVNMLDAKPLFVYYSNIGEYKATHYGWKLNEILSSSVVKVPDDEPGTYCYMINLPRPHDLSQ